VRGRILAPECLRRNEQNAFFTSLFDFQLCRGIATCAILQKIQTVEIGVAKQTLAPRRCPGFSDWRLNIKLVEKEACHLTCATLRRPVRPNGIGWAPKRRPAVLRQQYRFAAQPPPLDRRWRRGLRSVRDGEVGQLSLQFELNSSKRQAPEVAVCGDR